MLNYGKAPSEPTIEQEWAVKQIQEYQYRKMFNLSEKDFLEESFASFNINLKIKDLADRKEARELKKANRKARK